MKLFLSYAEEDERIAGIIVDRLGAKGLEVFYWQDPRQRGKRFIEQIETRIMNADAFLALLSPSFLRSYWCGQEREMALRREQVLRASDPNTTFINVAKITNMSPSEAGFLGSYDWLDMTSPENREAALRQLTDRLSSANQPDSDISPGPSFKDVSLSLGNQKNELASRSRHDELVFRNRQDELDRVLRGLTNASGPHFWLVVAPPQLGKTWFLERISTDDALSEPIPWAVRLVDLRSQPEDVRGDAAALLALLFDRISQTTDDETLFSIAQEITGTGRPHLCLLDSAELLAEETVSELRKCLSQIYRLVQDAGRIDVRLTFIVASRRDDQWKGVSPAPRLSPLPLTEFNTDIVRQALDDLSAEMDRTFSQAEFRNNATRVYGLTEGLPALLVRCLQWIRTKQWIGMDRLETQRLFEDLADPYIRQELLTPASLLPAGQGDLSEPLRALEHAYRVLAPYRLFTQSHLRHHLAADSDFRAALNAAGWAMEDLWEAIGGSALMRRPLTEPWQEIHAAIRRLLYRYFYKTDEHRAAANNEAREFVEIWADKQIGTEQVVCMVECVWHEAIVLGLRNPAEMEPRLTESARKLSDTLRESSAFTLPELRAFAVERMRNDVEFQEAVSNIDGFFDRLVEIVART